MQVRPTMNHEKAWPTKVLILSTKRRAFCIGDSRFGASQKNTIRGRAPDGALYLLLPAGVLRLLRRGGGLLGEVVVVGHPALHVGVQVPLDDALGVGALRGLDLLEERVAFALLGGGGV